MRLDRIKAMRMTNNLSQRALSLKIGVVQQQYAKWEQGINKMPIEALEKLCKLYNISADYILGLTDEPRTLTD